MLLMVNIQNPGTGCLSGITDSRTCVNFSENLQYGWCATFWKEDNSMGAERCALIRWDSQSMRKSEFQLVVATLTLVRT